MASITSIETRLRKLERDSGGLEEPKPRENEPEFLFLTRLGEYHEGPNYLLNAIIRAQGES